MSGPVIQTVNLTKRYRRALALDHVSLDVPAGSVYALVGPNGAGKTTTIKILMNLLPSTSGHCEVLGCDSRLLSTRQLARIGYVSECQELPDWMTVRYYLTYLSNFYPTWDRGLANDFVRQFSLPPNRRIRHLSHGMRMKTALTAALAFRPSLMILDEPFTGLDAAVRDELLEGVLRRDEETTIFISSHDLPEVESVATHVGYLGGGLLYFSEDVASLCGRFREVVLTFVAGVPPLPVAPPDNWIRLLQIESSVRITESRFDADRTVGAVKQIFPGHKEITVNPMSLRSIFVALARSSAKRIESQ